MNPRLLAASLIALIAHTAAPARTIKLRPPASGWSQPDYTAPQAKVGYADLDLRHEAGAKALRRRLDQTVIELSGGFSTITRPDVMRAREHARAQADAIIAAAQV